MSILIRNLVGITQTIDGVALPPFDEQIRAGASLTSDMTTAMGIRRLHAEVLADVGDVRWANNEGTALVGPNGETVSLAQGGGGVTTTTSGQTLYVRTDGSDSNDGSANDSAHAFATVQKALDVAAAMSNVQYALTISVATGTYAESPVVAQIQSGSSDFSALNLNFNGATISGLAVVDCGSVNISNLVCTGLLDVQRSKVVLGPCTLTQLEASYDAYVETWDTVTVRDGSRQFLFRANFGSTLNLTGNLVLGTNTFTIATLMARTGSHIFFEMSVTGSATGSKFANSKYGRVVVTGTTIPGDSAGTNDTGGSAIE